MSLFDKLKEKPKNHLLIGGHKGHKNTNVLENTVENFELIKDAYLSHIEIDLQLTADNEIVIYHDIDLSEKSKLKGYVHDYTVCQLKDSFPINTLDEVLSWCVNNNIPPALEVKCELLKMSETMPILARRLADCLNRHKIGDFGFTFSADYRTLWQIKQLSPDTTVGLIVPFVPRNPIRLMEETGASIYLCYINNLCRELVDTLHNGGYYVDGSVINDESSLIIAMELGVDLIESDYPEEMIKNYWRITDK